MLTLSSCLSLCLWNTRMWPQDLVLAHTQNTFINVAPLLQAVCQPVSLSRHMQAFNGRECCKHMWRCNRNVCVCPTTYHLLFYLLFSSRHSYSGAPPKADTMLIKVWIIIQKQSVFRLSMIMSLEVKMWSEAKPSQFQLARVPQWTCFHLKWERTRFLYFVYFALCSVLNKHFWRRIEHMSNILSSGCSTNVL